MTTLSDLSATIRQYQEMTRNIASFGVSSQMNRMVQEMKKAARVDEFQRIEASYRHTQALIQDLANLSASSGAARLIQEIQEAARIRQASLGQLTEAGRSLTEATSQLQAISDLGAIRFSTPLLDGVNSARELARSFAGALRPAFEASGGPVLDFDEIGMEAATSITSLWPDESGSISLREVATSSLEAVSGPLPPLQPLPRSCLP